MITEKRVIFIDEISNIWIHAKYRQMAFQSARWRVVESFWGTLNQTKVMRMYRALTGQYNFCYSSQLGSVVIGVFYLDLLDFFYQFHLKIITLAELTF